MLRPIQQFAKDDKRNTYSGSLAPICVLVAAILCPALVGAADNEQPVRRIVEVGLKHFQLSERLENTSGAYLKGIHSTSTDTWIAEVVHLDRFGDRGTLLGLTQTHVWNPDWYSSAAVGTSINGFFWPQLRMDVTINKKWLASRNLVTSIGVGYFNSKDKHRDRSLQFGAAYYFDQPWVLQGGWTVNQSDPGSVISVNSYAALTYGHDKDRFISLRYGFGKQGYQPLPNDISVVNVPFRQLTGTWREWFGRYWGTNLVVDYYTSKTYDQAGIEFGVFRDF